MQCGEARHRKNYEEITQGCIDLLVCATLLSLGQKLDGIHGLALNSNFKVQLNLIGI